MASALHMILQATAPEYEKVKIHLEFANSKFKCKSIGGISN